MESYKLIRGWATKSGLTKHNVRLPGDLDDTRYYWSVRAAVSWNPLYFLVAGEEFYDDRFISPHDNRGILKLLDEHKHDEISLDSFFNRLTDAVVAHCAEVIYADLGDEDHHNLFLDYLDGRNLLTINTQQRPFANFLLGAGLVNDYNKSGTLRIPKGSPLYAELEGVTRADLADKPELKFFRLNTLAAIVGGFHKFPPTRINPHEGKHTGVPSEHSWMVG